MITRAEYDQIESGDLLEMKYYGRKKIREVVKKDRDTLVLEKEDGKGWANKRWHDVKDKIIKIHKWKNSKKGRTISKDTESTTAKSTITSIRPMMPKLSS